MLSQYAVVHSSGQKMFKSLPQILGGRNDLGSVPGSPLENQPLNLGGS